MGRALIERKLSCLVSEPKGHGVSRKIEAHVLPCHAGFSASRDAKCRDAASPPLLEDRKPAEPWRKSIYYQYYEFPGAHMVHRHYGVRSERYKLIHYYQIGEWEFFDLKEDPHELRSVYDDPQYAEIRTRLLVELGRLRQKYRVPEDKDPLPKQRRRQSL